MRTVSVRSSEWPELVVSAPTLPRLPKRLCRGLDPTRRQLCWTPTRRQLCWTPTRRQLCRRRRRRVPPPPFEIRACSPRLERPSGRTTRRRRAPIPRATGMIGQTTEGPTRAPGRARVRVIAEALVPSPASNPGERGARRGMPSSLPPNASRERVRLCPGLCAPGLDARGDPGFGATRPPRARRVGWRGPGASRLGRRLRDRAVRRAGPGFGLERHAGEPPEPALPRTALLTDLQSGHRTSPGSGRAVRVPVGDAVSNNE